MLKAGRPYELTPTGTPGVMSLKELPAAAPGNPELVRRRIGASRVRLTMTWEQVREETRA